MKSKFILSILAILITKNVVAGETTGNFQTSANLSSSCILSVQDINFGVVTAKLQKATTMIQFTCSNGLSTNIGITNGNSGDYNQRTMKNDAGNDTISYNLYSIPASMPTASKWQNPGVNNQIGTGTGISQNKPITAFIESDPLTVTPGNYSDQLSVVFTY